MREVTNQADAGAFVVTGSTGGIGLATARRLLEAGAKVTVTGRSQAKVDDVCRSLDGRDRVFGVAADLWETASAEELLSHARETMGQLTGVVLSHGGEHYPQLLLESTAEEDRVTAEHMLLSNIRVVRAAVRQLKDADVADKSIVFVTSEAGRFPTVGESVIGACAAANMMFMRSVAREAARFGVRSNAVSVSITHETPAYERVMAADEFTRRLFARAADRMPLGHVTADHVAESIIGLLLPSGSRVTGQLIGVTAGLAI